MRGYNMIANDRETEMQRCVQGAQQCACRARQQLADHESTIAEQKGRITAFETQTRGLYDDLDNTLRCCAVSSTHSTALGCTHNPLAAGTAQPVDCLVCRSASEIHGAGRVAGLEAQCK